MVEARTAQVVFVTVLLGGRVSIVDASPFVLTCAAEMVYANVTVLAIARPSGKGHQSLEEMFLTAAVGLQTPYVSMEN